MENLLLTIMAGIVVFLITQIIMELYVKPYSRYKELQSEVAYVLKMFADKIHNPLKANKDNPLYKDYNIARKELRSASSKVFGYIQMMPRFHLGIPSQKDLARASTCLMFISNAITFLNREIDYNTLEQIDECVSRVIKTMKITTVEVID